MNSIKILSRCVLLLLLGLNEISAQVAEVVYYPAVNTLRVRYTGCDICLYGFSHENVAICECRWNCQFEEPSQQDYADFEACVDACEENYYPQSPVYYEHCLDQCEEILLGAERDCLEECELQSTPVRQIEAYQWILYADWADIPFDPLADGTINRIFMYTTIISSNVIHNYSWEIPSPWPGIYSMHNTCYGALLRVWYRDGTNCIFPPGDNVPWEIPWSCNIVG